MLWCFRILLPCYFYFLFGKQAFVFQLSIVVIKIPFRRNSLLYNHPFCCPGSEALGIIVVSLPFTAYHWGSLIVFYYNNFYPLLEHPDLCRPLGIFRERRDKAMPCLYNRAIEQLANRFTGQSYNQPNKYVYQ